jgi:YegS/Rv2252/BmrU family lipid kinase
MHQKYAFRSEVKGAVKNPSYKRHNAYHNKTLLLYQSTGLKKHITFIINPISGGIHKQGIPELIEQHLDHNRYAAEIKFTTCADDTFLFAREAVNKKTDVVVAVGGDGTINQVAKELTGTSTALGIVPQGSGNGFARHLRIPLQPLNAITLLNKAQTIYIDTGTINGEPFVNVCGAGFDAHVAWKFATAPKRGFYSYAKITLNEFRNYRLRDYTITIDGKPMERSAFLVCCSNGSQYGNNAYITPGADMQDGLLDIAILREVKLSSMPAIAWEMFTQRFRNSKYVEMHKGQHIHIVRHQAEVVNIDGEPYHMEKDLTVEVKPASLQVLIPQA